MPDTPDVVLCSKLCQHNPADPNLESVCTLLKSRQTSPGRHHMICIWHDGQGNNTLRGRKKNRISRALIGRELQLMSCIGKWGEGWRGTYCTSKLSTQKLDPPPPPQIKEGKAFAQSATKQFLVSSRNATGGPLRDDTKNGLAQQTSLCDASSLIDFDGMGGFGLPFYSV